MWLLAVVASDELEDDGVVVLPYAEEDDVADGKNEVVGVHDVAIPLLRMMIMMIVIVIIIQ